MRSTLVKALLAASVLAPLPAGTAHAGTVTDQVGARSGCSLPPCGALNNRTASWVSVKWSDNDDGNWTYASVAPWTQKGGFWHDGIDVDYFYVADGCRATSNNWATQYGPGWHKISSTDTVTLNGYRCSGVPVAADASTGAHT